jgi:hypothetical protein
MTDLMPYLPERALEDTAFGHDLNPIRLHTLFLPIWQVEVRATTTEGKPYELIDRYLERGIAEGDLRTVAELSRFFALDEVLVDRAVRFLLRIGHLGSAADGALNLTDLGHQSLRDNMRYVVTRQDRRKMYFDAYESRPLSRRYYDPGVVTFRTPAEIRAERSFRILAATRGFRREVLNTLSEHPDRQHYNLPDRLENPESLREDCVFLPIYLVETMGRGGGTRLLAYSQAADTADKELSELCERTQQIGGTLTNEQTNEAEQHERIAKWLARHGLTGHQPVRLIHGAWRIVLPVSAFKPAGPLALTRLGSFTALATTVVHIWCEDRNLRERALLARIDAYLERRDRSSADSAALVSRVGTQLGFESVDLARIRTLAAAAGRTKLVSRLDGLLAG